MKNENRSQNHITISLEFWERFKQMRDVEMIDQLNDKTKIRTELGQEKLSRLDGIEKVIEYFIELNKKYV